jgi:hypothetical protein
MLGSVHAEAMRKALAATRELVFVGFGAGLGDPNFGELRRWLAGVFSGSSYRHYRLCLEAELVDRWGEHELDERIVPIAYGARHDDLVPFLRALVPHVVRASALAPDGAAEGLPSPRRCFGRKNLIEDLVATVLAERPMPIPVLGPAGIGKSTVCITALHDARVVARFGERRYFVRCNSAKTGEAVFADVGAALGIPVGLGLTRFDGHPPSGAPPRGGCPSWRPWNASNLARVGRSP